MERYTIYLTNGNIEYIKAESVEDAITTYLQNQEINTTYTIDYCGKTSDRDNRLVWVNNKWERLTFYEELVKLTNIAIDRNIDRVIDMIKAKLRHCAKCECGGHIILIGYSGLNRFNYIKVKELFEKENPKLKVKIIKNYNDQINGLKFQWMEE